MSFIYQNVYKCLIHFAGDLFCLKQQTRRKINSNKNTHGVFWFLPVFASDDENRGSWWWRKRGRSYCIRARSRDSCQNTRGDTRTCRGVGICCTGASRGRKHSIMLHTCFVFTTDSYLHIFCYLPTHFVDISESWLLWAVKLNINSWWMEMQHAK